jgi:DNA-binding transcriptional regulator GbsR (MarR family)
LSETDSRLEALIEQLAKETRETITQLAQESRAANKLLEERIAGMTSGIGELIRLIPKPKE